MSTSFSKNADILNDKIQYTYVLRHAGQDTGQRAKTSIAVLRNLPPFETASIQVQRLMIPNFEMTMADEYKNNVLTAEYTSGATTVNATLEFVDGIYDEEELASALKDSLVSNFGGSGLTADKLTVEATSLGNLKITVNKNGGSNFTLQITGGTALDVFGITPLGISRVLDTSTNVSGIDSWVFLNPVKTRFSESVALCTNIPTNVLSNINYHYGIVGVYTLPDYGETLTWELQGTQTPAVTIDYDSLLNLDFTLITDKGVVMRIPYNYTWELVFTISVTVQQDHRATEVGPAEMEI